MWSIKRHQLTGSKPNNIFSTLDNLHAVLQLANKQISLAMLFNLLIIINDCSYNHTERKDPTQIFWKSAGLVQILRSP